MMFFRLFIFLLIFSWFSANYSIPVSPQYRKAALALQRYANSPYHNPVIYSLLNVLIHDKQARAFISDRAVDIALEQIKDFDQKSRTNNEKLFRQLILGVNCKPNGNDCSIPNRKKPFQPGPDLKHQIVLELDKYFDNESMSDDWPITTVNKNKY